MPFPPSITNALRDALAQHLETQLEPYSATLSRPTRAQTPDRDPLVIVEYEGGTFDEGQAAYSNHTMRFRCALSVSEPTREALLTQKADAGEMLRVLLRRLSRDGLEFAWQGRQLRGLAGCRLVNAVAAENTNVDGGGKAAAAVLIEWSDNGLVERYRLR